MQKLSLVGWDKSAAEARIVAAKALAECGSDTYWKVVQSGIKIHNWFGYRLIERHICPLSLQCWNDQLALPEDKRSAPFKTWYLIAKKSVHGFSYDLGPLKWTRVVAKETDGEVIVPVSTAKTIKFALYEDLDSIPKWQASVQAHLRSQQVHSITNAFGRRRIFFERFGDDLFREAYATEPQGTVADDVSDCIYQISRKLPFVELLQQNYDSFLGQCPADRVEEAIQQMRPIVLRPFYVKSFDGTRSVELVVPVTFKTGNRWGEMSEVKL